MNGHGWVRVGAILGFLAVGIGAFGAHGLETRLARLETTATYKTAEQYQMYHALAILALGVWVGPARPTRAGAVAGWAFLAGVILFSGSLYVLALTGIKLFGAITPFGGLAMMVGWVALAVAASAGSDLRPDRLPGSSAVEAATQIDDMDVTKIDLELHR
jgi:uncharacterized membrane protein YgdD (TMEM256/DUF423 family)